MSSAFESAQSRCTTAVKQCICQTVSQACRVNFGNGLKSVVLTGSLARNEATILDENGKWRLAGDAEFVVVLVPDALLPRREAIAASCRDIEAKLLSQAICCQVSMAVVHGKSFSSLPAHIFTYELRECGEVIDGSSTVLQLIPAFTADEISREDAWRMLCNRIVEHLKYVDDLHGDTRLLPPALLYNCMKLYLDMCTSMLIFLRMYEPTYVGRARRLDEIAATYIGDEPFDLRVFADRVRRCTRWKIDGSFGGENVSCEFWDEAVAHARLLWRWEIRSLTGEQQQRSTAMLFQALASCQTTLQRLRGWAFVVRALGWRASAKKSLRWTRIARHYTPRYSIYCAAIELFFRLPCLIAHDGVSCCLDVDWNRVAALLPEPPKIELQGGNSWRELAAAVVSNYERFVMETRA